MRGAGLGEAAEGSDVAEHLRERHRGHDLGRFGVLGVGAQDHGVAAIEVAQDLSHVLAGRADLDAHDRLQDHAAAGFHRVLEGARRRHLES